MRSKSLFVSGFSVKSMERKEVGCCLIEEECFGERRRRSLLGYEGRVLLGEGEEMVVD